MAEEIDIITLAQKIFGATGNFFKNIGKKFLYFIRFSYQNLKLLAIFLLIGVVAGVVFSQLCKTYKSVAIFKLNVSDANTFYDLAGSLETNVVSDQTLSAKLNLSDSITDDIDKITPHFIIDFLNNGTPDYIDDDDNFVETDTINVKLQNRLAIIVKTKNIHSFPKIQDGLVYFFANNDAFKEEKEVRQQQLRQSIEYIDRELKRFDELSNRDYFKESKKIELTIDSSAFMLGEKPRQLYYKDITRLMRQKDSLEKVLIYSADVVSVLKPFAPTKKNENGLIKMSLIFGCSFLVLGYITAAFRRYRKRIFDFLNS
ncbi:MAG: hypothetical protein LBN27_09415 [Prevotellaceae bacterium]|jgi:hypothetical protein|nr:hypothetical protein [Prevotellaceae bacterium]